MSMDILDFGKHKGESWGRIPVSYLTWLANKPTSDNVLKARDELKRRGTTYPTIKISGHAIDRASTRCLKSFIGDKKKNEGIYSWLVRVSEKALKQGKEIKKDVYLYHRIEFMFEFGEIYPTLKSVFRR